MAHWVCVSKLIEESLMVDKTIEHAQPRVNTPFNGRQQTPLDLSGMELAYIETKRESARSRLLKANPNPTPRDIARIQVLTSDMPADAKLFAVAVIELGGVDGDPISMPRSEARVLLSKSKDGFASAAEKFGEWEHAKVEREGRGKKSRYSILQNVLDSHEKKRPAPQASLKKVACSSGHFSGNEVACPTGQLPQKRPAQRATSLKDRGDIQLNSEGGVVVFGEDATPNEGNGGGRELAPTTPLESPYPDKSSLDINAREFIGADANKLTVHELHDKLTSACNGALARGNMALELVTEPKKWIDAGCDLYQDILPVLQVASKQAEERMGPGSIRGWRFFEGRVMEAMRRRTAPIVDRGTLKAYTPTQASNGEDLYAKLAKIQEDIQNGKRT
jgi:hypothetical protein